MSSRRKKKLRPVSEPNPSSTSSASLGIDNAASAPPSPAAPPADTAAAACTTASAVLKPHEVLAELQLTTFEPLMELSEAELKAQLAPLQLNPLTHRLFMKEIAAMRLKPRWLALELKHLGSQFAIVLAVFVAWLLGALGMSIAWALITAVAAAMAFRQRATGFANVAMLTALQKAQQERAVTSGETAEWLNGLSRTFWRLYKGTMEEEVAEQLNDILVDYKMTGMQSIAVDTVDLGEIGPQVINARSFDIDSETERKLDLQLRFQEKNSKIVLKIRLLGQKKATGFFAYIEVNKLMLEAHVRVILRFDDKLPAPFISTVSLSLLQPPSLDFGLCPMGRYDITKVFPGLDSWLDAIIVESLAELVIDPERIDIPIGEGSFGEEGADGLLSGALLVTVAGGKNLNDYTHKGSAKKRPGFFVRLTKGDLVLETEPIASPSPQWRQQFMLPVYSPSSDKISVQVLAKRGGRGRLLNQQRFRLGSDLIADGTIQDPVTAMIDMKDNIGRAEVIFHYLRLSPLPLRFVPPSQISMHEELKARNRQLIEQRAREISTQTHAEAPKASLFKKRGSHCDGMQLEGPSSSPFRPSQSVGSAQFGPSLSDSASNQEDAQPSGGLELSEEETKALASLAFVPRFVHEIVGGPAGSQTERTFNRTTQSLAGLLFVRVHEARGLSAPEERERLRKPFVRVRLNSKNLFVTDTGVSSAANPLFDVRPSTEPQKREAWREVFIGNFLDCWLEFGVYHNAGLSSRDLVGAARVNLGMSETHLPEMTLIDQWVYLDTNKKSQKPTLVKLDPSMDVGKGRLRFSVVFRPVHVNPQEFNFETTFDEPIVKKSGIGAGMLKMIQKELRVNRKGKAVRRDFTTGGPLRPAQSYPKGGRLAVKVHAGRGLLAADKNFLGQRSSDPYVIVKIGGFEVHRTKIKKRTVSPHWHAEYVSGVVQDVNLERLEFVCMDYDHITSDDLLGNLTLDLRQIQFLNKPHHWYKFTDGAIGELQLSIELIPTSGLIGSPEVAAASMSRASLGSLESGNSGHTEDDSISWAQVGNEGTGDDGDADPAEAADLGGAPDRQAVIRRDTLVAVGTTQGDEDQGNASFAGSDIVTLAPGDIRETTDSELGEDDDLDLSEFLVAAAPPSPGARPAPADRRSTMPDLLTPQPQPQLGDLAEPEKSPRRSHRRFLSLRSSQRKSSPGAASPPPHDFFSRDGSTAGAFVFNPSTREMDQPLFKLTGSISGGVGIEAPSVQAKVRVCVSGQDYTIAKTRESAKVTNGEVALLLDFQAINTQLHHEYEVVLQLKSRFLNKSTVYGTCHFTPAQFFSLDDTAVFEEGGKVEQERHLPLLHTKVATKQGSSPELLMPLGEIRAFFRMEACKL